MAKSKEAFRTISEVADWLETQPHVLRFWESKFSQVRPVKRAGGRRYYRPADMLLLGGIKKLLHDDGMTIKGAQKMLREQGVKSVSDLSRPIDGEDADIIEATAVETSVAVEETAFEETAAETIEASVEASVTAEIDAATEIAEIVDLAKTDDPALADNIDPAPEPVSKSVAEAEVAAESEDLVAADENDRLKAIPTKPLADDSEAWKRRQNLIDQLLAIDFIPSRNRDEVAQALTALKALRKTQDTAPTS